MSGGVRQGTAALARTGHYVGDDDSEQDGQHVVQLSGELEHDDRGGQRVRGAGGEGGGGDHGVGWRVGPQG